MKRIIISALTTALIAAAAPMAFASSYTSTCPAGPGGGQICTGSGGSHG